MLAMTTNKAYTDSATAKSVVRSQPEIKESKIGSHSKSFFYGSSFLVDRVGASSDAPVSLSVLRILHDLPPSYFAVMVAVLKLKEDFTMPNSKVVDIRSARPKLKTPSKVAEIAAIVAEIQKIQTRFAFDIYTKIVEIERRLEQLGRVQ